jgi:hypothetical protein
MQLQMGDILAGGFAFRQVEIDPITFNPAAADSGSQMLADADEMVGGLERQILKSRDMLVRYQQHMAWIDWLHGHECCTEGILVDVCAFQIAFDHPAERAIFHDASFY